MKNQPVLTIAIPIYNGERTIKNMLDILMPQCNEKIEVLVSDNCSTDSTPNIIKEYQNKWGNISYWCNETNLKTDRNCIKCLQKAKGKYTWLMSDDDIIMENAVDKILKFIENGDDMGLIYAAVLLITIIVFFKLLIDSDGSYVFLAEGLGLAAYLIILALILLLENIVAISALAGAIIIVGIVVAILIFGNSSNESAGSASSGSGGSTSYKSSSGNVGVKSRKPDKNTANTPAYKKDSNPNHHYIANYNEILGVKLYKVHGDMGDYIELDNTMVEKKICSLADAESGKHKFYREESGKEIRVQEIPWK